MTDSSPAAQLLVDVRRVLQTWSAPSREQGLLRTAFLDFVDRTPDPASRDQRAGHLTASTLLLDDPRERVLLTLHPLAGRWFQLGGHCEPEDVSIAAAAGREAAEESGIAGIWMHPGLLGLDRHPTVCRDGARRPGPSVHFDLEHLGIAPPGAEPARSDESLDLAWFPVDELPPGTDPAVRLIVGRARAMGLA
ncbi:MAG: NUDIX domain-containing protein [Candidatus Nanopelagicales bacterium]